MTNKKKVIASIIFIALMAAFMKLCGSVCGSSLGSYELSFGDDFNKGLSVQDDLGLSVVVAVDCSGSMSDPAASSTKPKYVEASESLVEIINFLEDFFKNMKESDRIKLKVGILAFNSDVKLLYPLAEMNQQTFGELKAVIGNPENFKPGGTTAIGDTLEKGTEMLAQSGTIFRSLIIISDGANTTGSDPNDVLDAIVNNRNNKTTADSPVVTSSVLVSFVGFDTDESTFKGFNKLGARVTSAENKAKLNESLKNIFLADITKLESK